MKLGLIGLGRMGQAIAHRLLKAGLKIFGFDINNAARNAFQQQGGTPVDDIKTLAEQCSVFWLMLPAGTIVDEIMTILIPHMQPKNIIIDGGNSHFTETIKRAQMAYTKNIFFLDCGTSGGLKGREIGFSLMIGGDKKAFQSVEEIFQAIAAPNGYAYLGPAGTGHYVKMIHNGIEYALLQSYADGFNLLKHGHYKELNLETIARVWSHGSVIRSWILDLTHEIFLHDQDFSTVPGCIGENLTGQWTLEEAKKQNVPSTLLEEALAIRTWSRKTKGNYATKLVALLRNKFGGHEIKK